MKIIERARKVSNMDVKENFHIYRYKQLNVLIENRKEIKDNVYQNCMFDIVITHENTSPKNVIDTRL
jgi:hypothetical protein